MAGVRIGTNKEIWIEPITVRSLHPKSIFQKEAFGPFSGAFEKEYYRKVREKLRNELFERLRNAINEDILKGDTGNDQQKETEEN